MLKVLYKYECYRYYWKGKKSLPIISACTVNYLLDVENVSAASFKKVFVNRN